MSTFPFKPNSKCVSKCAERQREKKMKGVTFHSLLKECVSVFPSLLPVLPSRFLETDFRSVSCSFTTVSVLSRCQNTAKLPSLPEITQWSETRSGVPSQSLEERCFAGALLSCSLLSEPGTASVLSSVLVFSAKGAEFKSAVTSDTDKQSQPSWQVWLGATERRKAAYCPPTCDDVLM